MNLKKLDSLAFTKNLAWFLFFAFFSNIVLSQVTISPWKINKGAGIIAHTNSYNGDPAAYSKMNIPAASDPNWTNAPVNANGEINYSVRSILSICRQQLDFTYFETYISIPANYVVNDLKVSFNAADDGARAYIFNSAHPNGAFIGQISLGGSPTSANYASLAVAGEINRMVIVQFDDCPTGNNLTGARVNVNGQVAEINTGGCTQSNFFWSNAPTLNGKTATGTINGIGYTYTSTVNVRSTSNVFNHSIFPASYNVPNANPTIQNIEPSSNTLTFASPMTNPVLVFSSIGGGPVSVPINFSAPVDVLWSTNTGSGSSFVQNSPTQITGREAYAIVRMNGTFSSISFDYLTYENYVNFAFGADFSTNYPDTVAPTLTLNGGATENVNFGTTYTDPGATVTDNCDTNPAILVSGTVDTNVPGNYTLTYTAVDASGNTSAPLTRVVTVIDPVPVVVTQNITVSLDGSGNITVTPAQIDNGSNSVVGLSGLALDISSFNCSNIGVNTVVLTATSTLGSTATGTANVTVIDNAPPVITSPADITVNTDYGICGAVVNFAATVADNCEATVTYDIQSGSVFGVGTTVVTATATDTSGNTTNSTFSITVIDNQKPTITSPFDITTNADADTCGAVVNYEIPTASDNCGTGTPPTTLANHTYKGTLNGHTYFLSNTTVTPEVAHANAIAAGGHLVTISDAAENLFVSQFNSGRIWIGHTDRDVEGQWKWISNEPVNYTNWAPGEPNNAGGNEDWAVINWSGSNPDWNDWYFNSTAYYAIEFDGGTLPTTLVSGPASGDVFPVGTTTVTYEAVDASGNKVQTSFNVTVIDNQAPSITAIQNINVFATSAAGAIVNYAAPVGEDNCASTTILSAGLAPGATFPIGTTLVTYTATDTAGNSASTSFNVTVTGIAPVITVADITVNNDAGVCGAVVNYIATETTVGIPAAEITYTIAPGSSFNVGTVAVTATATNAVGASSSTFNVTVKDNEVPNILTKDVTVQLNANGGASITAAQVDNGSSDNCAISTMVLDTTTFDCSNVGAENTVTLTVTDVNGNVSTNTAIITVIDSIHPTVVTQAVTVQLDASGVGSITAAQVDNGSSDNCAISTMVIDTTTFDCSNVGAENTVTLTVTDVNGNVSTGTAIVTVVDSIHPTVVTQAVTVQLDASGVGSITVAQVDNGSSDNCAIATMVLNTTSFDCANVGENTVTLTVTDVNGNISSKTATITVVDSIVPTISNMPADITVDAVDTSCELPVSWNSPTGDDNCSFTLTSNYNSGDVFPVGTTEVTYTVMDASGNTDAASFSITVNPIPMTLSLSSPTLGVGNVTCFGDTDGSIATTLAGGCEPYSYSWSNGDTTANANNLGAGTYTLTVSDSNGSSISEAITLTEPDVLETSIANPATISLPTAAFSETHLLFGYPGNETTSVQLNSSSTGGNGGNTYSWSAVEGLSDLTSANPTFAPTMDQTGCQVFTLTLTVTDSSGCSTTQDVVINAVNVGVIVTTGKGKKQKTAHKVLVCHKGKRNISIDYHAVPAHLAHGDSLGSCEDDCGTSFARTVSNNNLVVSPLTISVYPNPSDGVFEIKLNNSNEASQILLFDLSGKLIERKVVSIEQADKNIVMDKSFLPSGVYLLKVITKEKIVTKKVVIQRE